MRKVIWTFEDEQKWRAFVESETGARLLLKISEATPKLRSDGDLNAILVRMGEVKGVSDLMDTLMGLTHSEEPTPTASTEYPELTNDAAWNDGQKIEPHNPN